MITITDASECVAIEVGVVSDVAKCLYRSFWCVYIVYETRQAPYIQVQYCVKLGVDRGLPSHHSNLVVLKLLVKGYNIILSHYFTPSQTSLRWWILTL